jgi:hypothetical protein
MPFESIDAMWKLFENATVELADSLAADDRRKSRQKLLRIVCINREHAVQVTPRRGGLPRLIETADACCVVLVRGHEFQALDVVGLRVAARAARLAGRPTPNMWMSTPLTNTGQENRPVPAADNGMTTYCMTM